jgi:hypothetical protein
MPMLVAHEIDPAPQLASLKIVAWRSGEEGARPASALLDAGDQQPRGLRE